MTKIEWTEATWNPIVGCSLVSPGCTNCYAMRFAGTRLGHLPKYDGLTQPSKAGPVWTGKLAFDEKALLEPLRWKKPRMVFVNSMGDLFHEDCPDEWIDRVFAVMALCPQHTFQVLTKRSGRMREWSSGGRDETIWEAVASFIDDWSDGRFPGVRLPAFDGDPMLPALAAHGAAWGGERPWPLKNVWLGVSVEDQQRADERIPDLLATPAAIRWISAEPLLGPVDLEHLYQDHPAHFDALSGEYYNELGVHTTPVLDWVVAGGESGKGARPMHPDWARSLRDQCAAAGVPFFFKQWGEWAPRGIVPRGQERTMDLHKVGKKRAGRLLDGVLHDAMPEVAQ
jgi:protein gp37